MKIPRVNGYNVEIVNLNLLGRLVIIMSYKVSELVTAGVSK